MVRYPKKPKINRCLFNERDIIAITLRYLLSRSEIKDLHPLFGSVRTSFDYIIDFGINVIISNLINDDRSKIYWDRSIENMDRCARRTKQFLDIPNVVAMIDGDKIETKTPANHILQNRDYNGWTKDVNRNLVLIWDPFGKIVDCAVNCPGNFHDSRSAWWCKLYDHIAHIPDGYLCCCDDAFVTSGELRNKLVKTKEPYNQNNQRTGYDEQLTHLRQCSEWGNNVLTGCFRRLRNPLPTHNIKRARLMWCCILLHNWRTNTVGRNQIKTYFDELEQRDNELENNS